MSGQQQIHNIFAETHDEHDEADVNNAYGGYAMLVADSAGRTVAEASATRNSNTTHEAPPALPSVTNLYNAAQTVGGSVMPHAQMLLQAAAGGHQSLHQHAGTMPYSVAQPNNNQLPRQPMNIFDAAEDAYAQHIADLHAANQYSTVEQSAAAATHNLDTSNVAAAGGGGSVAPTLPPIYPKNIGMPETVIPSKWLTRYNELKRYKQVHGHCCVPQDVQEHKQLSAWVRTQKQQYKLMKEGKHCHMSQPRVDLLNEIEFEWSGVKRDQFWKDRYNELVLFHSKTGHTRVPEKYPAAPQLHSWVSLQRRQLKLKREGKKNKLTDDRLKLLEALGMEFQIRNTATWMDRFAELKGKFFIYSLRSTPCFHVVTYFPSCIIAEYKEKHGDCNVPQKYPDNPSLGR